MKTRIEAFRMDKNPLNGHTVWSGPFDLDADGNPPSYAGPPAEHDTSVFVPLDLAYAAPKMLEALKAARDAIDPKEWDAKTCEARKLIHAAIDQAEELVR